MSNIARFNQKLSAIALAVASAAASAEVIEEVVVSAQFREQTLQEVPVAVSAFRGDMMKKAGIEDVRGLVDLTPGFNGKTEDSFIDALSIRGIVTNDFGIGGDPSVAIFQDGVWAGRNGGVQMSFYDMERAEVVKGPQSTLFGRNAIAGGISIITKKPIEEFEGNISATIAEHDEYEFTGTVNIPLSDQWFFRGSTYFKDSGGYLDNLVDGDEFGGAEASSTRLALRYAGDEVDAVFRVTYEDRDQDPSIYWTGRNGIDDDEVAIDLVDGDGMDESEILVIQANIEWTLSDNYTLTSITGFKSYDFDYLEDYDATPLFINNYGQSQEVSYWSQEFRLNFDFGGSITGFIGASYYEEDIDATFINAYNEDHLCIAVIDTDDVGGALGCDDPVFEAYWEDDIDPADILDSKAETNINDLENKGWAVYGDVTWQVTDRLDLTVGGRYTLDKKDMAISVPDSGGALGNTFVFEWYTDGFVQDDDDWSKFTPRLAVNYELNDQVSLYANTAKGYKSGGYSTFGIENDGSQDFGGVLAPGSKPLGFDPEESTSYEIGAKTTLLDGSMQLNIAYFRYDYEDLQLVVFESGSQLVKNLGEAENQGIELDMHWTPGENWDVRAAMAWQDSEITEELEPGDGSKGNELPMAPEFSGSVIATYNYPLESGNAYVTLQHVYQDSVFGGHGNFETAKVDSWHETALRIGYESEKDWSVVLWVENLTDEVYFERGWENADADDLNGFGLVNTLVWPAKPRTVGVTFDMSF